ncbi:MAG: hypothetical protein U1E22_02435, partial [Coriobacteriia bacterium]|nr:hypothetical protein [Coriobacteriia bacterium]
LDLIEYAAVEVFDGVRHDATLAYPLTCVNKTARDMRSEGKAAALLRRTCLRFTCKMRPFLPALVESRWSASSCQCGSAG